MNDIVYKLVRIYVSGATLNTLVGNKEYNMSSIKIFAYAKSALLLYFYVYDVTIYTE